MHQEHRAFAVDSAILYSVIHSQAGSLAKALLEGAMNSVDAGATRLAVKLSPTSFQLRDNGRGFQNREDIVRWFETFGTPHVAGDATYGRFRMGRGQLMAFAATTWRTGTFQMQVDIRPPAPLGYGLTEKLSPVSGCRIEGRLYDELTGSALQDVITEFSALVRYLEIPVTLNGRRISRLPETEKWDFVTEDAYVRLSRSGPLEVYNLGVKVCDYASWQYGASGVVVSRKPLDVNFARNDILTHSCQVWRSIRQMLLQVNYNRLSGRVALTANDRTFLVRRTLDGTRPSPESATSVLSLKLLTDADGRPHCLMDLLRWPVVTAATEGKGRVASLLQRTGAALVLGDATLKDWMVDSAEELMEQVKARFYGFEGVQTRSLSELAVQAEVFKTTSRDELSVEQRTVLDALESIQPAFVKWLTRQGQCSGARELHAGESNAARAWTDGATTVTFNRSDLTKAIDRKEGGMLDLVLVLIHEYCHDSSDLETHEHDLAFYAKFHDLTLYHAARVHGFATSVWSTYCRLSGLN